MNSSACSISSKVLNGEVTSKSKIKSYLSLINDSSEVSDSTQNADTLKKKSSSLSLTGTNEKKGLTDLVTSVGGFAMGYVDVQNKDILSDASIQQSIKEIESDLTVGRVLVRPSGTENKIRVMVESDDEPTAKKYAEDIAKMFIS